MKFIKKIMRNYTTRITHYIGPAYDSQSPNPDYGWFVLMKKEREYDQDHKERPGQYTDPAKVVLDVGVIRVELCCARCWHESRGFAYLSSVFPGHNYSF
jgi:hypothetical protein